MTKHALAAVLDALAPVVREFAAAIGTRLTALEAKERGLDGRDGAQGPVGPQGPAGSAGRDGRDGLPGLPGEKGVDGQAGRDGRDGIGLDELTVEYDGHRTFTLKTAGGGRVKTQSFQLPVQIYCGVYQDGTAYDCGDTVTWGGSMWVAKTSTTAKPGESDEASRAWTLAVKRGRDGRSGAAGKDGAEGKPGRAGKDLTQVGFDGSKW